MTHQQQTALANYMQSHLAEMKAHHVTMTNGRMHELGTAEWLEYITRCIKLSPELTEAGITEHQLNDAYRYLHEREFPDLWFTYMGEERKTPILVYSDYAFLTDNYPRKVAEDALLLIYLAGLTSEVGEVAGKIKKLYRDKDGVILHADIEAIKHELGDCLWYFDRLLSMLGTNFDEVADMNLRKLWARFHEGKIGGDGDDR